MNILSMSGFVPEQICDTVRFTHYSGGGYSPTAYCGYAADFVSQVMDDPAIDGAVYPKSCDSSRIMGSYMEKSGKFLHQLSVPAGTGSGAITFFAEEIKRYQRHIEAYYHVDIKDIAERTELLNERNRVLRSMYDSLASIDYYEYLRNIHDNLQKPLRDQKMDDSVRSVPALGKKIFVTGSFLSNLEIAGMIEQSGLKVVGDNLPESGRLCSLPETMIMGDIYYNIALNILGRRLSPTQNDFQQILESDCAEMQSKAVDGVIMVIQKYCEPYEFLYSVYQKYMEAHSISVLKLVLLHSEDISRAKLQIEAFADII